MEDWRKAKYGKAPTDAKGIAETFTNPTIFESLGKSLHKDHGQFFNCAQIEKNYTNCIFSSPRSIQLIKEELRDENERFFLMDGTFSITPRGAFQQVLIIYAQFGIKVCSYQRSFYFT